MNNVIHVNFRSPNRTKPKSTKVTRFKRLKNFLTSSQFSDVLMTSFVILMSLVFVGLGVVTLLMSIK